MPRLPTREQVSVGALQPSRAIVGYQPGGAVTTKYAGVEGQAMARFGDTLAQVAGQEKDKLDKLKTDDRITQLMQAEVEMSQEYESVKGAGIVDPEYHKRSEAKYKGRVAELSADLTPTQRQMFDSVAKRREVQFNAGRYTYSVREAENYHAAQYDARMNVWGDKAATGYNTPAALSEAVMGVKIDTAKELARRGYTDPNDPVVKTAMAKAEAGLWGRVLDHALVQGDTAGANSIYASAKGLMTDEQRRSFESRMKPANDYAEGQKLALEAQQMASSGKTPAEIELHLAKASTPGAYSAAQTVFTNFQQAAVKAEAEKEGALLEKFELNGAGSKAMSSILSDPEYAKLSDAQQGKLVKYMRTEVRQSEMERRSDISWAQSQADRKEKKAQDGEDFSKLGKFMDVLENPQFPNMTRAELYALTPDIGKANVTKLITEQARIVNEGKSFKIDKDILDAAIPEKLLEKGNKDKLNAFRGHVEAALIDWKTANPGKVPDYETQRRIAASAGKTWTEVKNWWPDKEHPAYEGPPPAWVEQLQQSAKKRGKILTQPQIDRAWRLQSVQGQ